MVYMGNVLWHLFVLIALIIVIGFWGDLAFIWWIGSRHAPRDEPEVWTNGLPVPPSQTATDKELAWLEYLYTVPTADQNDAE
jgi:hypothetical protein